VSREAPKFSASAAPEHLLEAAARGLHPESGAQDRVRAMMRSRMRAPEMLRASRDAIVPHPSTATRAWSVIKNSIGPVRVNSAWDKLHDALEPAAAVRAFIWNKISPRLNPQVAPAFASYKFKWGAAIAVVVVVARFSPLLFLAPPTIAESAVTLLNTSGTVEVLSGSFWQPIRGEITLTQATTIQTQNGEATIILHDDAVFRLAPNTRVTLYDLSDRPERGTGQATIALQDGQLWALGLVPKNVRGVSVVTTQGRIVLHEGSASIKQDGDITVAVWDRSAAIERRGKQTAFFTGQQVTLARDGSQTTAEQGNGAFEDAWVAFNLSRDAAHRHDIAQLQQERRAASAGILPGTTLYPVKRLAEEMDVFFTFGEEQRVKKRVTQANTRLNEAAALLKEQGDEKAVETALQEYKTTVLQVMSGSGGSALTQSILKEEVVDGTSATIAASLPGDASYPLKLTVQQTIAALPESFPKPDVHGDAIIDELAAVKEQAEQGDTVVAKEKLTGIASSIAALGTGASVSVSPESLQEAEAIAMHVTAVIDGGVEVPVEESDDTTDIADRPVAQPRHAARLLVPRPMSQEQVVEKAQEIRGRIFAFGTKKAQQSQLRDQLRSIEKNPDRGRILRELAKVLPRNGLAQRVEVEIRNLSEEVEEQITASGGTADLGD
jgi:hypothetical protein